MPFKLEKEDVPKSGETSEGSKSSSTFHLILFLSHVFTSNFFSLFYRFNSIWLRNGPRKYPKRDSIRTERNNDLWIWARERWSVLREVVQGEARVLPLHAEGNSIDKNIQATWHTGWCKSKLSSLFILFARFRFHLKARSVGAGERVFLRSAQIIWFNPIFMFVLNPLPHKQTTEIYI